MKTSGLLVCIALLVPVFCICQPGASCSTPISIPMDGVLRNYTISSATGSNLVCTSSGTTPVTYFSIVSNSSAQNMTLRITGPNSQAVEVVFYDGTSCTNGNMEAASSVCFYDGHGVWAPAANFVMTPNKTYIVRIKTSTTGTIQITGQHFTPPNNSCSTATPIGTELIFDNNASHKPGTGVAVAGLCSAQLENTAFYQYTVEATGNSGISIENMSFDNNYESNLLNLGFEVGLFTGSCGSLTSVACFLGIAPNVQLNTGVLPAGTTVYVAIDGILGSNCDYGIRAINSSILPVDLKNFTAFKAPDGNILRWVSLKEIDNAFFNVERSVDGISYKTLTTIPGNLNSNAEKEYEWTDLLPPTKCFYRLRMTTTNNKTSYSNIIKVDRGKNENFEVRFGNVVSGKILLQVNDAKDGKLAIKIVDEAGREVHHQNSVVSDGNNIIEIGAENLLKGLYYLILSNNNEYRKAFPFIKS